MKQVRCAIYTRKSSEEGLEQGFNSLDAQREACSAYILSQASEGWTRVPGEYDDGGLSGGTLERPGLQRLLADIDAGKIDIIVVYKVDRLTRSLLDFAKLVEAFDRAGVSFVSITQSFNTTTSMGRLTLNMLLSFAQFEREVTAERIRDKIAASKAKGMWMGGTPPLGYEPDGRTLKIVEAHAAIIGDIFARYLELRNVRFLQEALSRDGIHAPRRQRIASGASIGGRPFSRGQLYKILKNRVYLGEIVHGDQVYAGLHPPIVGRETWGRVQELLAENLQGAHDGNRSTRPSLLTGMVVDDEGLPLLAVHSCKGKVRYRYYVSRALQEATSNVGVRIPAREIEGVVVDTLARLFDDPVDVISRAWLEVPPHDHARVCGNSQHVAERVRKHERALVREIVHEVRVTGEGVSVACSTAAIAAALDAGRAAEGAPELVLATEGRLARSGRRLRLVDRGGASLASEPNAALVRLVAQAHRLWSTLRAERIDVTRLAAREDIHPGYLTRVLRLAFLSPTIIEAILAGRQHPGLSARALTLGEALDGDWSVQANTMLRA